MKRKTSSKQEQHVGGGKERNKKGVCVGDEETGPVSPLTYKSITQ